MTPTTMAIGLIVVVALAAGAWYLLQRRRSEQLREQFGPEYGRALQEYGGRRGAEKQLAERQERVHSLQIVPLSERDREAYAGEWREVQSQFVDEPGEAIVAAHGLVDRVMAKRGYPMLDFEQQSELISVEHPQFVSDYRAAHAIAERQESNESSTEDLRRALIHYRSLFEDLLGQEPEHAERVGPERTRTS